MDLDASRQKAFLSASKPPTHLKSLNASNFPSHTVIVPAFLNGDPRIYTMSLTMPKNAQTPQLSFSHIVTGKENSRGPISPRVIVTGSGGVHLNQNKKWARKLVTLLNAHNSGKISPDKVAEYLAKTCGEVVKKDRYVSENCLVVWKHRESGGGFKFFSSLESKFASKSFSIPTIANGIDINAIVGVLAPSIFSNLDAKLTKKSTILDLDIVQLNKKLETLPKTPDDTFI